MLAGFVDGRGRAYDLNFRTLRFTIVDADGFLATEEGEAVAGQAPVSAEIDLMEPKVLPLLFRVEGILVATPRRTVFLASGEVAREGPSYTHYNVRLGLPPTAIEHFFTAQGGREFLQFGRADVETSRRAGDALEVVLRGPRPGSATETARYALRVRPPEAGEAALAALR